jgi:hypothetical protein
LIISAAFLHLQVHQSIHVHCLKLKGWQSAPFKQACPRPVEAILTVRMGIGPASTLE